MDDSMKHIYKNILEISSKLIEQDSEPLAVAAVLMTTALSIYRTTLKTDDEYDLIVDAISKRRYDVKTFSGKGITLQ